MAIPIIHCITILFDRMKTSHIAHYVSQIVLCSVFILMLVLALVQEAKPMCRRWLKKQNIPCEWNLNFETGFASARAVQQCTLLPFLYWWVGVWIKPMTMNAKRTKKYQETNLQSAMFLLSYVKCFF